MSVVYFALVGDFVKVGVTTQLEKRMRSLRRQNGIWPLGFDPTRPVELLRAVPGTTITERLIHHALAPHRAAGEWFHATPRCLADIAYLTQDGRADMRRVQRMRGVAA